MTDAALAEAMVARSLMTATLRLLREKGLLTGPEINQIYDDCLRQFEALQDAGGVDQQAIALARTLLEMGLGQS